MKEKYLAEINEKLNQCQDIALLDLILKLLAKVVINNDRNSL